MRLAAGPGQMPRRVAVLAAVGLLATGCGAGSYAGSTARPGQATYRAKSPITIGYSVYDLQSPYFQSYVAGVRAEAKAKQVVVKVADEKSSELSQVSGSADLLNQGVSALVVSPVQPAALPATVAAAHAKGVPVIVGDVGAIGDYDAYIQSNNRSAGALAARYFARTLGGGSGTKQVGVIGLHSGSTVGDDRVGGFTSELRKHRGFTVVSTLAGNDTVVGGFTAAQGMLSANPKLDAIFAANDPEAQGASRAISSAGRKVRSSSKPSGGVALVGVNGDAPSLALIGSGGQTATVAQDPTQQGRLAVDAALDLLRGHKPKFTNARDRTIEVPVSLVDARNLAAFEKKGA